MSRFELLPAIDLIEGRVVRLRRGDFDQETSYGDDPVAVARAFADAGARWLHVVDLDGARAGEPRQLGLAAEIVAEVYGRMQVEIGGGLRTAEAIAGALGTGAARAVIGTAAAPRSGLRRDAGRPSRPGPARRVHRRPGRPRARRGLARGRCRGCRRRTRSRGSPRRASRPSRSPPSSVTASSRDPTWTSCAALVGARSVAGSSRRAASRRSTTSSPSRRRDAPARSWAGRSTRTASTCAR